MQENAMTENIYLFLDLAKLNQEEKCILTRALLDIKNKYLEGSDLPSLPTTKQLIINDQRVSLSHHIAYHYERGSFIAFNLKKLLGSGGQGKVYASSGELILKDGSVEYIKNNNFAIKILTYHHDSLLKNEVNVASKLSYLGFQKPLIGHLAVVIIMNRIKGYDMHDALFDEKKRYQSLSLGTMISLSLKILNQIQFIHMHEILHLDIKLENFMINQNISPRLIDFGLAIPSLEKELTYSLGVRGFAAPELINSGIATTHADAYAAGVVLAFLWGHLTVNDFNTNNIYINRKFNLTHLDSLNIPEVTKIFIHNTIHGLVRPNIGNSNGENLTRLSIEDAIKKLHKARLVLKTTSTNFNERQAIYNAFKIASAARIQLRQLNCPPDEMKKIITEALNQLDDKPVAFDEFCEVTNTKALRGLKTRTECLKKLDDIILEYLAYSTQHPEDPLVKKTNQRAKLDNMAKIANQRMGIFAQHEHEPAGTPPPPKLVRPSKSEASDN